MTFTLDPAAVHSCPVRTQNDLTPGLEPPPRAATRVAPYVEAIGKAAAELLSEAARLPGAIDLRTLAADPRPHRVEAARAAMAAGAPVIVGAVLPADEDNHRRGRADVLVRVDDTPTGAAGYLPVRVKGRRVLDTRTTATLQVSPLATPAPAAAQTVTGFSPRGGSRIAEQLELVHLWLLLAASGHASGSTPMGGLLGTDDLPTGRGIAWLDLTDPCVARNPRELAPMSVQISPEERYRFEYDLRVELAEAALAGDTDKLLQPIRNRECDICPWWPVCRPQLDDDDLSLRIDKWPLDVHEIRTLRRLGVTTVSDLAAADLDELLPAYEARLTHRDELADRLRQAQHRSRLLESGVELERTTSGPVPVPAAGIEVDLDIEASADNRVYLWGFLVHDRAAGGTPYYRAFAEFGELTDESELALAQSAFAWLRDLAGSAHLRVYHYSAYEVVRLQALARTGGLDWALGLAESAFVDLFGIVREHFFGAHGLGLKNVARAGAGFEWRDSDPSGLNSQIWFSDAVAGPESGRAAARDRILEYNEDDVRATWHVRQWLRSLDAPRNPRRSPSALGAARP